jgi:hypothetical protein
VFRRRELSTGLARCSVIPEQITIGTNVMGAFPKGNIAASINLVLRLVSRSQSTTAVKGFHRIRHYGFFANTSRAETIARERESSVLRLAAAVSSSRKHHA